MKIKEQSVVCSDGSYSYMSLYNVDSIFDIEENSYFGVIVNYEDFFVISPLVQEICMGYLSYDIYVDEFLLYDNEKEEDDDDDELESALSSDKKDRNYLVKGHSGILLIFKKLNGPFAQEILSGEVITIISDRQDEDLKSIYNVGEKLTKSGFENGISKYSENALALTPIVYSSVGMDKISPALFEVNDHFKICFAEKTLPKKDEIIKKIKEMKKYANEIFKSALDDRIKLEQSIALTDKAIYDFEQSFGKQKIKK